MKKPVKISDSLFPSLLTRPVNIEFALLSKYSPWRQRNPVTEIETRSMISVSVGHKISIFGHL